MLNTQQENEKLSAKSSLHTQVLSKKVIGTLKHDHTMKFRCMKGVWRQRPPIKALVFLICIFSLPQLARGKLCGFNEMRKCNNRDCECLKCLDCPPGQGLSPQCGSTTLKGNMTMKCLPCQNGTYSDQNDFESCHPCDMCGGQETLQICNASQNAVCKKGCPDGEKFDEFFHECEKIPRKKTTTKNPPSSTRPYTADVPSLTSTTLSSNKASGPDKTAITARSPRKTVTARSTSAVLPTSNVSTGKNGSDSDSVIKTIEWIAKPSNLVFVLFSVFLFLFVTSVGSKYRKKIKSFIIRFKKYLLYEEQNRSDVEAIPMNPDPEEQEQTEIIVDLTNQSPPEQQEQCFPQDIPRPNQFHPQGLDSCPSVHQTVDQNHAISRPAQQQACSGQGIPGPDQLDPEGEGLNEVLYSPPGPRGLQPIDKAISNPLDQGQHGEGLEETTAMPDIPDLYGVLLKDIPSELEHKVAVKISRKDLKGWKEIARFLKVADDDELEDIETRCSYGEGTLPGTRLFEILKARLPRLNVKKFTVALQSVKRQDIIYCMNCGLRKMFDQSYT